MIQSEFYRTGPACVVLATANFQKIWPSSNTRVRKARSSLKTEKENWIVLPTKALHEII